MVDPAILRLVAITDDSIDHRSELVERAAAAVRGGATCIQLRLKNATPREVVDVARALVQGVTVPVIVNDRADLALAAGAAGVHVGEGDLPVVAVRRFAPPNFLIGASLGSERELENARDADYVGIGPMFASGSKTDAGEAIGIDGFKRLAALCNLPAVAIGGITAERVPQIMEAGAAGVAAINAIFRAGDPEAATRLLAAAIGK
jgi:thiamine-phosphate pyrophosphorylase